MKKFITRLQRLLLKSDLKIASLLYYKLAEMHFEMTYDTSLLFSTLNNTEEAYKAAKRHSRMVVSVKYRNSDSVRKKMIRAAARGTFVKNIILSAKI